MHHPLHILNSLRICASQTRATTGIYPNCPSALPALQEAHIERLRQSLDSGGDASLQNAVDTCVDCLRSIPPYGHREVLVVLAALSTCDPGNILESVKAAKAAKVRVSVVGLAAEVHVCRTIARDTGGTYGVATGESHLEELVLEHATPPPAAPGSSGVSLVRMGFPARAPQAPGAATFVGPHCALAPGAFACPRCKARTAQLPGECHVCGLTLVASPHLARSYHHLFPVRTFEEVKQENLPTVAVRACYPTIYCPGMHGVTCIQYLYFWEHAALRGRVQLPLCLHSVLVGNRTRKTRESQNIHFHLPS